MPSQKSVPWEIVGSVERVDTEQARLALCLLAVVDVLFLFNCFLEEHLGTAAPVCIIC
jgi:hypothetical protein